MGVNYVEDVANVKKFCPTYSLLFKWQGSIYKLLWREVLVYFLVYVFLGVLYRFVLDEEAKATFEMVALCCEKYCNSIPVVLMLGFFTGTVMQRWWAVYNAIPGVSKIIALATFYLNKSQADTSKWLRTLTRYILLAWMLGMRNTCQPLRNKFPDLESIEEAGLLLKHEKEILYQVEAQDGASKMCLTVTNWALLLIKEGRDAGYFESASDANRLFDPVFAFKKSLSSVLKFQSTPIPLSFIQAVTLMVNIFAVVSLMGKQFFDFNRKLLVVDCYLPILPAMQYLAYVSWLRLGEVSVNPFGDDDDDFDIIALFDNHIKRASDILLLFELGLHSPTKESLELTQDTLFKEVSSIPMLELEALKLKGSKANILGGEIWRVDAEPAESTHLLEGLKMGVVTAFEEDIVNEKE